MKVNLGRLRIVLALAIAALIISVFPATSYAETSNYWPPYPSGYGSSYGCVHGVRFGETLNGIAARYGTSTYYLMQINGIPNPNLIYAGTALRVPCSPVYPMPYRYPKRYPYPMPYPQPYPTPIYPTPSYGTPMPMPTPPTSGQVLVVMRNIAFSPATITIHAGQTVMWRNDDGSQHTTTSGSCPNGGCTPMPGWDSGALNPGQSFSHQFTMTGTFPYYCRIHGAMMQGAIVVMP